MNGKNDTLTKGRIGEQKAAQFYESKGYEVIQKNYRFKRAEIDLIVSMESVLVFVEVKFRDNDKYGYPEEFVSDNQKKMIISAADHFITEQKWEGNIRFDIIAISGNGKLEQFEDAFY